MALTANPGPPDVLDAVLPRPRHREVHRTTVRASVDDVWAALQETRVAELTISRPLMWLRGLGAAASRTALEGMTDLFEVLVHEPPRTLVVGGAGQPWRPRGGAGIRRMGSPAALDAFDEPVHVAMAASIVVEPASDGRTLVTTETRVRPTDGRATALFAPYWALIRIPSGLIRRDLLRAVRRRAERG